MINKILDYLNKVGEWMFKNYKIIRITLILILIILFIFGYILIERIIRFIIIISIISIYLYSRRLWGILKRNFIIKDFFKYYEKIRWEERRKDENFLKKVKDLKIFFKFIYILYILINPIFFILVYSWINFYYFFRWFNWKFYNYIWIRELVYFCIVNLIILPIYIIHHFWYRIIKRWKELGIVGILFKRIEGLIISVLILTPIIDNVIYYFGIKNICIIYYIILVIIGYFNEWLYKKTNEEFDIDLLKLVQLRNKVTTIGINLWSLGESLNKLGVKTDNNIFFWGEFYNCNNFTLYELAIPIYYKNFMLKEIKYKPSFFWYINLKRSLLMEYLDKYLFQIFIQCKKENIEYLRIKEVWEKNRINIKKVLIEIFKIEEYITLDKNLYLTFKNIPTDLDDETYIPVFFQKNPERVNHKFYEFNEFVIENNENKFDEYLDDDKILELIYIGNKEDIKEVNLKLKDLQKNGLENYFEDLIITWWKDEEEKKRKVKFYKEYDEEISKIIEEAKKEWKEINKAN